MKRTSVRLQLTYKQLWQAIELVMALGGKVEGKTYVYICQLLFDSLLISKETEGAIDNVTEEEAKVKLDEFRRIHDIDVGNIDLIGLNTLAEIEVTSEDETERQSRVSEAIMNAERKIEDEDLSTLFPDFNTNKE